MREKNIAKQIINGIHSIVNILVLAVLLALLAFSAYVQWDSRQSLQEASAGTYAMYKPNDAEHLTFSQLMDRNPDVFAWLTLNGTNVDYPLVQGSDNTKYINTSAKGDFSLSGAIFLDWRCRRDLTGAVSILYGHHMEDDAMFGGFDKYADPAYFDSHRQGTLFLDGKEHKLNVFAFLEADGYDTAVYDPSSGYEQRDSYLQILRGASLVYREDFDKELPILLMSTCEAGVTNGRMILAATIGPAEDVTASPQEVPAGRGWRLAVLIVPAAGLLLLILLICRKKSKKKKEKEQTMESMQKEQIQEPAGNESRQKAPSIWSDLLSLLLKIGGILLAFVLIFTFLFGIYRQTGTAMAGAVHDRDLVFYYRLDKAPDVRDLVVYERADGQECLGRVIAGGGDSVDVTSEGLKINGYLQQEDYVKGQTLAFTGGISYPLQLQTDEYFIMGDNREQSQDSRYFGAVSKEQIKGRVITVLRRRDF